MQESVWTRNKSLLVSCFILTLTLLIGDFGQAQSALHRDQLGSHSVQKLVGEIVVAQRNDRYQKNLIRQRRMRQLKMQQLKMRQLKMQQLKIQQRKKRQQKMWRQKKREQNSRRHSVKINEEIRKRKIKLLRKKYLERKRRMALDKRNTGTNRSAETGKKKKHQNKTIRLKKTFSAVNSIKKAPDFVVTPRGEAIPIPNGSVGTFPTRAPGFAYKHGKGGKGMNSRVTGVRIMESNKYQGRRAIYMNKPDNRNKDGQIVDPNTGRTVSNKDKRGHKYLRDW